MLKAKLKKVSFDFKGKEFDKLQGQFNILRLIETWKEEGKNLRQKWKKKEPTFVVTNAGQDVEVEGWWVMLNKLGLNVTTYFEEMVQFLLSQVNTQGP